MESDWEPLYEEYSGAACHRVRRSPLLASRCRLLSTYLAVRSRASPGLIDVAELALYASPFLLLAGLLLSGRFVGEETILRRRAAAPRRGCAASAPAGCGVTRSRPRSCRCTTRASSAGLPR